MPPNRRSAKPLVENGKMEILPSGQSSKLEENVNSTRLRSLPESLVELGMVLPLLLLLTTWWTPQDQLSEMGVSVLHWWHHKQWTHCPAASGISLVEKGTASSVQTVELVAVQLTLKKVAFCKAIFSQTPGLLLMVLQFGLAIPSVFRNAWLIHIPDTDSDDM